jgi:type I restriction enzyme S subunit
MKHAWYSAERLGGLWSAQAINQQVALHSLAAHKAVSLGELCCIESGQYVDWYVPEGSPGGNIRPYLRVDNIRPFVANMSRADLAFVHRDHPAVLPRSIVQASDVVIARTGTLGKAALVVGEMVGAVMSQHVTRLTVREKQRDEVSPELLCAFLNSPPGRAQLLAGGAGSTRRELTHERLAAVRIPIIGDERRHELARRLQNGTERLAESGTLIRKAIALYEAVLLSASDPATPPSCHQWAPAREVRTQWNPRSHCPDPTHLVPHLPEGYELVSLASVADILRGKGTRTSDYSPAGIPFVRTTSLINGGIDPFPDHYAALETWARFGQPTQDGDLLLSIEGKIGAVAYLTDRDRCVFKNHIERIRPRDRALAPDLFLALASELGQAQMHRLTVFQATLPGLASRSRQILVPWPPSDCLERRESHSPLAKAREYLRGGLHLRRTGLDLLQSAVTLAAGLVTPKGV